MALTAPNETIILELIKKDWEAQMSAELNSLLKEAAEKLEKKKPAILAQTVMKIMNHYDVYRDGQTIVIKVLSEAKP